MKVLIVICRHADTRTLNEARAFRAWLWSIAANLCRDHLKRQSYRDHLSLDRALNIHHDPRSFNSPDRDLEDREVGQIIDRAIAALKPYKGEVHHTSLDPEAEETVRRVLKKRI